MLKKIFFLPIIILLSACSGLSPQDWQNFGSSIQRSADSMTNQLYYNTQVVNQMTQQIRHTNQSMGYGWAPQTGVRWNNVY